MMRVVVCKLGNEADGAKEQGVHDSRNSTKATSEATDGRRPEGGSLSSQIHSSFIRPIVWWAIEVMTWPWAWAEAGTGTLMVRRLVQMARRAGKWRKCRHFTNTISAVFSQVNSSVIAEVGATIKSSVVTAVVPQILTKVFLAKVTSAISIFPW